MVRPHSEMNVSPASLPFKNGITQLWERGAGEGRTENGRRRFSVEKGIIKDRKRKMGLLLLLPLALIRHSKFWRAPKRRRRKCAEPACERDPKKRGDVAEGDAVVVVIKLCSKLGARRERERESEGGSRRDAAFNRCGNNSPSYDTCAQVIEADVVDVHALPLSPPRLSVDVASVQLGMEMGAFCIFRRKGFSPGLKSELPSELRYSRPLPC